MRYILPTLLLITTSCVKSTPPTPSAAPLTSPSVEAAPAIEVAPEPVVEEPAAPETNANFSIRLTYNDGRVHEGRVVYVQRGDDRYAEDGFIDEGRKLNIGLESGSDLQDVAFSELGVVDISYGDRNDFDCLYDSSFHPWMYMCTLKSTVTALLGDGSSWDVDSRYQWKLTFDDGTTEAFYLKNLPIREQEAAGAEDNVENSELYRGLQTKGMTAIKTALIKIEIL